MHIMQLVFLGSFFVFFFIFSIHMLCRPCLSLDHVFANHNKRRHVWNSAWGVSFYKGSVDWGPKGAAGLSVRLVRSVN